VSSFLQYVAGKTIAVVGPAPAPYDQSAEVDAHDLVYRCSYGWHVPEGGREGDDQFESGRFPAGYGTRVDMAFYNGGSTRLAGTGRLDPVYADLDWAIHKYQPDYTSPLTNVRAAELCRWPARPAFAPNQVTWMLYDLSFFEVQSVTVFGADFYMGPTETWYDPAYLYPGWEDGAEDPTEALSPQFHDQEDNREFIRLIRQATGWPVGDDRFLKALNTPAEVHRPLLEAERLKHAKRRGKA
jgi:hypothetical protein